jgi:hypothetical protein
LAVEGVDFTALRKKLQTDGQVDIFWEKSRPILLATTLTFDNKAHHGDTEITERSYNGSKTNIEH